MLQKYHVRLRKYYNPPLSSYHNILCRTDSQFACVCDNNLMPSQDLRTLTVNLTQKVIIAVQPQDLVSFETFQYLLSLIWFQHNPAPPNGNYTSTVSVVVFDGQLYSQPVFTTVTVRLLPANPAPIVAEVTHKPLIIHNLFNKVMYMLSTVGWYNQQ